MEFGAPSEILPVEVKFKSPDVYLLDFDYFEAVCRLLLGLFFGYLCWPKKGQVFSSTYLNLMKEHSEPRCVNLTTERLLSRSERTPPWVKNIQVHEVNGPHHGLKVHEFTK